MPYEEEGSIIMPIMAGLILIGGVLVYTRYQKGGGSCNKTCPTKSHLDKASCTCIPDSCTKTCPSGQHVDSSCTCIKDSTNGNGGGGVATGSTWYKANGTIAKMPWVRKNMGKCGQSSSNSGGNRWENVVNGFMDKGLEVVAYFTIKSGSMCGGGHVGLKHGGPQHKSCPSSDVAKGVCGSPSSCCCWWDTGIDNDAGKAYVEIESSHPHNCRRKYYTSVGKLDSGRPMGVRWHIMKEGNGYRLMQWVDKSGKVGGNEWFKTYDVLDTGQFMPTNYKPTSQQNVEIRISDVAGGDITMHSATSRKITGSGSSSAYTNQYNVPIVIQSFNARAQMGLPLQMPYPYTNNKRRNNRPFSVS